MQHTAIHDKAQIKLEHCSDRTCSRSSCQNKAKTGFGGAECDWRNVCGQQKKHK